MTRLFMFTVSVSNPRNLLGIDVYLSFHNYAILSFFERERERSRTFVCWRLTRVLERYLQLSETFATVLCYAPLYIEICAMERLPTFLGANHETGNRRQGAKGNQIYTKALPKRAPGKRLRSLSQAICI